MNKEYEQWKEKNKEDIPIIIAHRAIKFPMLCPNCGKWTKPKIKTIKADCETCNKEFEKDPLTDQINEMEILRDAAWFMIKLFSTSDEVKIQYTEKHQTKAECLAQLFYDCFGIEVKDKRMIKVENEKTKQPMIVTQIIVEKPEHMKLYQEKKKHTLW